jgi:hypothetical protein
LWCEREGKRRNRDFFEIETRVSFFEPHHLIIHEHQVRHLIDEEVPSLRLFEGIAEEGEVLNGLALVKLAITSVTGSRCLITTNLLK